MTREEASDLIVSAAIIWWSQHTYERDLRAAIELICSAVEPLSERERTVLACWLCARLGSTAMTTAAAIAFGFWIGINLGFLLGGFVCLWGRVV
jgi:hypothetical protein